MRKNIQMKRSAGFTLVELMIAAVIICVVIAVVSIACIVFFGKKAATAVDRTMDDTQGPAVQQAAMAAATQYAQGIENEPNPTVQCGDNASLFDHKVDCAVRLPTTNRVITLRCPYQGGGICTPVTHP